MARPGTILLTLLAGASVLSACATAGAKQPFRTVPPEDLRRELARRIPPAEVVVPFELSVEHARKARDITTFAPDDTTKVNQIIEAMFNPMKFGLRYQEGLPGTAEDAFRNGGGDCLALASVFVGLARAVGLDASYMDASFRMQETEVLSEQTTVKVGHITAFVRLGRDRMGLDFARLGRIYFYEPMDDVEAVAHYYNNLGYILLERDGDAGSQEDWIAAAHQFTLATQVEPRFARAWNNLGVALVRLGQKEAAVRAYRRAIDADPTFPSPHLNLGSFLLETGELEPAQAQLEAAARLDPSAANVQYELGVVRLRLGDNRGAARALEKAIALRRGWPAAETLLEEAQRGSPTGQHPGQEG